MIAVRSSVYSTPPLLLEERTASAWGFNGQSLVLPTSINSCRPRVSTVYSLHSLSVQARVTRKKTAGVNEKGACASVARGILATALLLVLIGSRRLSDHI